MLYGTNVMYTKYVKIELNRVRRLVGLFIYVINEE